MPQLQDTEERIFMSNIQNAFKNRKAFIPFVTCGFPDLETTGKVVRACAESGADLIELGIPFSDPTAEGEVIQKASIETLKNGITTDKILDFVEDLRKDVTIPLVFMTYANVIFSYGAERFMSRCKALGVDGIILPDLPYEEKDEFADTADKYGIDMISLVAPTSGDRISMISKDAKGFIYIVSSLGVTGVRSEITTDIKKIVEQIRQNTDTPCAVGFGISKPEQAKEIAELADGVIVGSAIVNIIDEYRKDAPEKVREYVKAMTDAIH